MGQIAPLTFNLKMFSPKNKLVIVASKGYESIIEHRHDFVEIGCVLSGVAKHVLGGKEQRLKQRDIFIIADDSAHYIKPICPENDFRLLNIIFDHSLYKIDYSCFKADHIYSFDSNNKLRELIEKANHEYDKKDKYYEEVTQCIVGEFLYTISRERISPKRKNLMPSKDCSLNNYINNAVEYIRTNYNEDITVDEVAYEVGLSKGYLQRLFKEQRNTSILKYLITYRMEQSCKFLIETDYPISKIADTVGINDLKHFYSIFKRYFGMTPAEYRANKKIEKSDV